MPAVLVLVAAALFGTTGTARALGLAGVDPLSVGALRTAVGGSALAVLALLRGPRRGRRPRPLRSGSVAVPVVALVLGGAGVVAYQPSFFAGVTANGVAVGTLLALGSAPVFTGLASALVLHRRPGRRWLVCTTLAVLGVLLLSGLLDDGRPRPASLAGMGASLAAGAAYAVYALAIKVLLDRGWSTLSAVGGIFGLAAVIGVVELAVIRPAPLDGRGIGAVLWLGLGTVAVAYLLFARGLSRLPAATVSTLTLAEPVVASALGVVVLGERITALSLAGAGLLLAALVGLAVRLPRRGTTAIPVADAPR